MSAQCPFCVRPTTHPRTVGHIACPRGHLVLCNPAFAELVLAEGEEAAVRRVSRLVRDCSACEQERTVLLLSEYFRPFAFPSPSRKISTNYLHSLFLSNGRPFGTGATRLGRLGLERGDVGPISVPEQIAVPTDMIFVQVAAGAMHSLVLSGEGTIFAFGYNRQGQLGLGDHVDRWLPEAIQSPERFVKIAAGDQHSLALAEDGRLFSWGWNQEGQLGLPLGFLTQNLPTTVRTDERFKDIAAGSAHSLALTHDGRVFAFGGNQSGQLGTGDQENRPSPTRVVGLATRVVVTIAAGELHSLLVTEDGSGFAFGRNTEGELGGTEAEFETMPRRIPLIGVHLSNVAAGAHHSLALTTDGRVFVFGRHNRPTELPTEGLFAVEVAAGVAHSFIRFSDGAVFAFGENHRGQLGVGRITETVDEPEQVWINLDD